MEFFKEGVGDQIKIEIKLFDSGPQVIESIFARSIDVAYVGPDGDQRISKITWK